MELELYTYIKNKIATNLPSVKTFGLYNNQFQRTDEGKQNAFLFPAVFISFTKNNFSDLSQGVQEFDLTVTTHLGFEMYNEKHNDKDLEILTLKQDLYEVMQRLKTGYFSRLSRTQETQDFDHDNIQVYTTEYQTYCKDYTKDIRPVIEVTVTADTQVLITSGYTF